MDTNWNNTTGHDPGEDVEYYVASQIQQALGDGDKAPGVVTITPKAHPRLRAWTGVLALLVGFALVVGSLGGALGRWITFQDSQWWKSDWRETSAFRREVSQYLENFLTLGAGGELSWYSVAGDSMEELTTSVWLSDWGTQTETAAEPAREGETAPDAAFQGDKNVLYRISGTSKGERVTYTNTDASLSSYTFVPEGYSFYLVFRDGSAQAWMDGEKVDLYGDGVYREGSAWYLPGYENFPAGEDVEDVVVQMAVRTEPIPSLQGQYASGSVSGGSAMYDLYETLREARAFYLQQAVMAAAGTALLIIARRLRQDRRKAEARIARWTVHVWTEARFLAVAVCLLGSLWMGGLWDFFYAVQSFLYRLGAGSWPDVISLCLSYGLGLLLSNLPAVLALCLVLWLIHNDHRYNPRESRKSLVHLVTGGLRARDLKRPMQKRISRRALARPLVLVVLAALFPAGVKLLDNIFWDFWFSTVLTLIILLALGLVWLGFDTRRELALARDIGLLADRISAVRSGDLDTSLDLPGDADLHQAAEDLNNLRSGLRTALEERTRSERMKVELISNVSHDLKTPLTSILSYAELLRQEPLEGAAADYARIIDEKAQRLKGMVQDVFEVSKAAADQLPVTLERLDLGKLLRQTLADMADPIEKSGLTFRLDLPEREVPIVADGKRLYRVFQNLIQNALQYALEGSRVYLTLTAGEGRAEAVLRNTSRTELPAGVDFTARFVRGDESRTDGGSGLGLSIAKSFTEACGGTFRVETVADLFTAAVSFPLAKDETP